MGQQKLDFDNLRSDLKSKVIQIERLNQKTVDSFQQLEKEKLNIKNVKTELIRVDKNFGPIYYQTHNLNAAKSNRTNAIQPGGDSNLNLEGDNMKIGLWDSGIAFEGHQEFNENNMSRILIGNQGIDPDDHATHVAGTLIANGTNPEAKGMAPKASVVSYDWNNVRSEELQELENGLLLSNHSYGTAGFDDAGEPTVPTDYFGTYDSSCIQLDEIHYAYPYYLHVTSAGNNGQNNYNGGVASGYDKLLSEKNAKNNLVVANGKDINYITPAFYILDTNPSSSQGPTNDLRIKPDITGNGTGLTSPIFVSSLSFNDYGNYSGTSMAAPSVTGSLALLQQYYHQRKQKYMRSATLKGLVCHTADDIGDTGPDPESGWGYINIKSAAKYITEENKIHEITLVNNDVIRFDIIENNANLKVTICWTDPPGYEQTSPDYNQPVLVNDLDIKITQNGNTYFPWKFSGGGVYTSTNWASKGDNSVDNIEVVEIENASGVYSVAISHKGSLINSVQDFSLIISKSTENTLDSSNSPISFNNLVISYNPSLKIIDVNLKKNGMTIKSVSLYDLNGRQIKRIDLNDTMEIKIDTANLISGLYLLKIKTSNGYKTKKVLIY